jgi:hypothetical protein
LARSKPVGALACANQNPRRSETAVANADGWFEASGGNLGVAPMPHAKIKSLRSVFHKALLRAVPHSFYARGRARTPVASIVRHPNREAGPKSIRSARG